MDSSNQTSVNDFNEVLVYPAVFSASSGGLWTLDREITAPVFAFMRSGEWNVYLKTLRSVDLADRFRSGHSLFHFTKAVMFCLMRAIAMYVPANISGSKKEYLDRMFNMLLNAGPGRERGLAPFSDLSAHAEVIIRALNAVSSVLDRRYKTVTSVEGVGVTAEQLQELMETELDIEVSAAARDLREGTYALEINYGDSDTIDKTSIETYLEPELAVPVLDGIRLSVSDVIKDEDRNRHKRNTAFLMLSAAFLEMLSLTLPEGEATPGTLTELLGGGCSECGRCMTAFDYLRMLGTNPDGAPVYAESLTGCGIPEYVNDTFLPLFCAVYCCEGPVSSTVIANPAGDRPEINEEFVNAIEEAVRQKMNGNDEEDSDDDDDSNFIAFKNVPENAVSTTYTYNKEEDDNDEDEGDRASSGGNESEDESGDDSTDSVADDDTGTEGDDGSRKGGLVRGAGKRVESVSAVHDSNTAHRSAGNNIPAARAAAVSGRFAADSKSVQTENGRGKGSGSERQVNNKFAAAVNPEPSIEKPDISEVGPEEDDGRPKPRVDVSFARPMSAGQPPKRPVREKGQELNDADGFDIASFWDADDDKGLKDIIY